MTKRSSKRSPESKARMAKLMRSRRDEIGKRNKERMADPKIGHRIRDGMQAAFVRQPRFKCAASLDGSTAISATRLLVELTKTAGDQS
ncbi:hypothetical protein AB4Z51_44085 [Bradyrhizobium sp. 2TAF36]|uniref:hypothetical protein n=1 Tax=unclassified Bradyrhizobium TaxID=2631580 RepID=UPI003395DFE4